MKQALTEALAYLEREFGPTDNWPDGDPEWIEFAPLAAAARLVERLLPGECSCVSERYRRPGQLGPIEGHPPCHGSGRVWDEGIVEAVADVLIERRVTHKDQLRTFTDAVATCREDARAVLSALVELLTEKVET